MKFMMTRLASVLPLLLVMMAAPISAQNMTNETTPATTNNETMPTTTNNDTMPTSTPPMPPASSTTDFELTPYILQLSDIAAKLSALAYEDAMPFVDATSPTGFTHPDYDRIQFYTVEPDQAIIARSAGRCFVAFRGTTVTINDWSQNIDLDDEDIFPDNNQTAGVPCETRQGFSDFLRTDVVGQARLDLIQCVQEECAGRLDDCVVLTGHSQGGASAAVLAILTYSLQPYVISFGMPPAVDKNCPWIRSEKFYRYVNMRKDNDDDVGFDVVPFSPTFVSRSSHYGHYIIVGPDATAVKYLGIDLEDKFKPDLFDEEISAHTMSGEPYSYAARIAGLYNTSQTTAVGVEGFSNGVACETSYDQLCSSGSCQNFQCKAKLMDLCIPESCKVDADCATGFCVYEACAVGRDGMVENGCPCRYDSHCASGECDQAVLDLNWECVPAGTGGGIFTVSGSAKPQKGMAMAVAAIAAGLVALL